MTVTTAGGEAYIAARDEAVRDGISASGEAVSRSGGP